MLAFPLIDNCEPSSHQSRMRRPTCHFACETIASMICGHMGIGSA
jgi:hypothetical protein